jgi:hypothetical protein
VLGVNGVGAAALPPAPIPAASAVSPAASAASPAAAAAAGGGAPHPEGAGAKADLENVVAGGISCTRKKSEKDE